MEPFEYFHIHVKSIWKHFFHHQPPVSLWDLHNYCLPGGVTNTVSQCQNPASTPGWQKACHPEWLKLLQSGFNLHQALKPKKKHMTLAFLFLFKDKLNCRQGRTTSLEKGRTARQNKARTYLEHILNKARTKLEHLARTKLGHLARTKV